MSATQSGVLYVKFKPDSVFTVSKERVDEIARHFQQDATFVTHFALARLYDDIQNGKYQEPSSIPLAERWLNIHEVAAVKAEQAPRIGKRKLNQTAHLWACLAARRDMASAAHWRSGVVLLSLPGRPQAPPRSGAGC